MRVAMICEYPVDPQVVPGGVTAVAHYLARGLGRQPGLELHIVCCQPGVPRDSVEERDGATVHFLIHPERLNYLTNWFIPRRKIARVVRRVQPDLVHGQGLGLPTAAALDLGLPFGITLHGVIWRETGLDYLNWYRRLRGRLHARVARRQMLHIHNVFVISRYAAQMLPPEGDYRQFQINNPVGDDVFAIRNEPRRPHILVVGGIRHRKDPLTALRVMEHVLREEPDATMHLLGPPSGTPFDQQVADQIIARRLDHRVKLLGLVPDEVLRREYERASVLLLTSLEETAPVAIAEAYAVGIPVVGTSAGGIPFMVREGETGFVRPIGDAPALAERVLAILRDSELRARLSTVAREVGRQEYGLDSIAQQTVKAYEEILAGG